MANHAEPPHEDFLWTIAAARLVLRRRHVDTSAAESARAAIWTRLIRAGINDWGGVSPVTPDHVNPEAPWPELDSARRANSQSESHAGRSAWPSCRALRAIHARWVDPALQTAVRRSCRFDGLTRAATIGTRAQRPRSHPQRRVADSKLGAGSISIGALLNRAQRGERLESREIAALVRRRRRAISPPSCAPPTSCGPSVGGRRGDLCRQPQHQLHQHLPLHLQLLRVRQRPLQPLVARSGLRPAISKK